MSENWYIPQEAPRGLVMVIHGMCEYAARYEPFARFLNTLGYGVYACDLPGHGADCTTLGYAPGDMWADTLTMLRNAFKTMRRRFPGLPAAVFGHSYGSFLLQRLLPEMDADGFILSGSCLQTDADKLGRLLQMAGSIPEAEKAEQLAALTFEAYNRSFAKEGRNAWLTRDREQVDKYNADALCGFVCSGNFYRGLYGGLIGLCDPSWPPVAARTVPVLVLSGDKDPVGMFGTGVRMLHERYQARGYAAQLKLYPDGRHEMLHELNCDEVLADIRGFLQSILG